MLRRWRPQHLVLLFFLRAREDVASAISPEILFFFRMLQVEHQDKKGTSRPSLSRGDAMAAADQVR
jgi:hypothetical protein